MINMGEGLTLTLPSEIDLELNNNITFLISSSFDNEVTAEADPDYEQFLADVWVGIVLTLMVLSCVCCMCSCLLYHKFQQWKRGVIESRNSNNSNANVEAGGGTPELDLPSYTIASGLPTYQEALEQLQKVKALTGKGTNNNAKTPPEPYGNDAGWVPRTPPTPLDPLSVVNLFQLYRPPTPTPDATTKPSST